MRFILVDNRENDFFQKEFDSMEEAIEQGEYDFDHMTTSEKKRCSGFYVLESVNPDEDAEDHFDGNIIKQWI